MIFYSGILVGPVTFGLDGEVGSIAVSGEGPLSGGTLVKIGGWKWGSGSVLPYVDPNSQYKDCDLSFVYRPSWDYRLRAVVPTHVIARVTLNAPGGKKLVVEHLAGGVMRSAIMYGAEVVTERSTDMAPTGKTIRMVRAGGSVFVYCGSSLLYTVGTVDPGPCTFSWESDTTSDGLHTIFDRLESNLLVTFGGVPASGAVVTRSGTILVKSPPHTREGLAQVVVSNSSASVACSGGFTYYPPPGYTVGYGPNGGIMAIDDGVLRDE